jgi:hypothetical protein
VGIDDQHLVRRTPAYRRARRCQRLAQKTSNLLALAAMSPREIYRGLLWIRNQRKYRPGWEWHAFRELFGTEPRPRDKGEPVRPSIELEEWINARQKRKRG